MISEKKGTKEIGWSWEVIHVGCLTLERNQGELIVSVCTCSLFGKNKQFTERDQIWWDLGRDPPTLVCLIWKEIKAIEKKGNSDRPRKKNRIRRKEVN